MSDYVTENAIALIDSEEKFLEFALTLAKNAREKANIDDEGVGWCFACHLFAKANFERWFELIAYVREYGELHNISLTEGLDFAELARYYLLKLDQNPQGN